MESVSRLHWNHTGGADAIAQWSSTGDPVLICIIGTHWKTAGATSTLECHWNHTASTQWYLSGNPVLICIIGTHWKTTGRPLEAHWKHASYLQIFPHWHSGVHWGLKFQAHWIATGLPLDYHWLSVKGGGGHSHPRWRDMKWALWIHSVTYIWQLSSSHYL